MAFWDRITQRGRVEDRRSMAPVAVGGISITGLALLLLFNALTGGSPEDILNQLQDVQVGQNQYIDSQEFEGNDTYENFTSTVLGSNNAAWSQIFTATGKTYTEPTLVLFRHSTPSGCGTAASQVGPHYCPLDQTIYLDETFFDELRNRLGAQGGDVAQAYIIAHEVGHHVQNQLGVLEQVNQSQSNDESIRLELQADCFAGLWLHSLQNQNILEQGEIHEAMDAASAVGDDHVQETVSGYVNPENWTHGSSEERVRWLDAGWESGNTEACNTFSS